MTWQDREERTESEKDRNEYKRKDGLRLWLWPRLIQYKRVQREWVRKRERKGGEKERVREREREREKEGKRKRERTK